jgi:ribokinase
VVPEVIVVGQLARDLVLCVDDVPGPGGVAPVRLRREILGGKGANQAVAMAQLGLRPALVAVAGDDEIADRLLTQAHRDGIDVRYVTRRPDTQTGLIVDLLPHDHRWRYLEHLPEPVLLTKADVTRAGPAIAAARAVLVQLQQPSQAALTALHYARNAMRVLDGAPPDDNSRDALLANADVIRADTAEARKLTGRTLDTPEQALQAGRELLKRGPRLVALAVGQIGNAFIWSSDQLFLPLIDTPVIDTTGAGDAFIAALTTALLRGQGPHKAARLAVAAAAATVTHPGGRPNLTTQALTAAASRLPTAAPQHQPHHQPHHQTHHR